MSPRILVVEDSATQAQLLRLILEEEGFAVEVVADAPAALALLRASAFDLVVSDVLMEGLTGFDLCRMVREDPALRHLPVVLVTTLRDPLEIVQALEVGADSFIRKPYDADALVGRLRWLLARVPSPADTPRDGAEAIFNGRTIRVHADRDQVLHLLLGTFEDVVRANTLLREREAQLSVAKQELEEAARMKDIFFATLSHELRTPLTAIVGWVHILKQEQGNPAVVERAVATIERNLTVQNTLIADLLDVSRIASGKLELEVAPLDLQALVGVSVDSVRPAAAQAGIQLEVALAPLSAAVTGDIARLQQVFANLLGNALKFTPRGGTVRVGLQQEDGTAVLTVADSGAGIQADVLPHVFERFRQASVADTRAGGLGLGLAIVKHIVEKHEGTVTASSAGKGRGAAFTVTLPLDHAAQAGMVVRPAVSGQAALAGVSIVVADDQPDSRDLIEFLLTRQGARVTPAASAAEAFAAVTSDLPDVLLSDIEMPDENGYDFIRRIRALSPAQGGTVQAAAMTAHGSREDKDRALAAGFQRHLPKPFQPDDLFALVRDLAGRGAVVSAPGDTVAAGEAR